MSASEASVPSTLSRSGCTRRRVLTRVAGAAAVSALGLPAFAYAKAIRIGCSFDNSGVEKSNGSGLFAGSSACINAVNKAGGIHGSKIELVMADDQFKPELAKAHATLFSADASVLAMLHPLGTRQVAEIMDAVPGMAVVGPNTGTVALRRKNAPNTFWLRANYDQEVDKLVANAVVLGIRKIGVAHSNDPLGQSVLAACKASLARHQLEPVVISTTPSTTSLEVEPAALAIAKAAPQVVITGLAGTAPAFIRALRKAGGNSTVYGLSIMASSLTPLSDEARGIGFAVVVPSPHSTRFEVVRRYQADLEASGGQQFSLPSLEGYLDARVLVEGLRRAGPAPTRGALISALAGIEAFDLGGIKINFGRGNREGNQFVDVAVIGSNGRLVS